MSKWKAWIKASRIPAQSFIFPSLLLGQSIGYFISGNWNWMLFMLIHLYGIAMHLFIVYANDYADYESDLMNTSYTPFTGGSRVLIEGSLSKKDLLTASYVTAVLSVFVSSVVGFIVGSVWPILLAILGIGLLHAYSFKPIKLSYRGFGEILQMLGVGLILPLIGYIGQGNTFIDLPFLYVLFLMPAQLAMAISTSLPDEPSDRETDKNTTVVKLGNQSARIFIVFLYALTLSLVFYSEINQHVHLVFSLVLLGLLFVLTGFSVRKTVLPGTQPMFYLVAVSILTNTLIVTGIAISLIIS